MNGQDPRLRQPENALHSRLRRQGAEAGAVSVRTRGKGDQGSMPLADFIAKCKTLVASQSTEL